VENLIEKLSSLRLPIVIGDGPKDARLLLLGEALGKEEVLKGKPFVGDAGYLLNDVLRCAGIDRSEVYIMNVVPTRPPDNKIPRLGELGVSLEECEEWCRRRISELRPNCVLALGAVALHALTGHREYKITDWRGSILEADVPDGVRVKIVPTFHPSYIQRNLFEKTARKEREEKGGIKYTYGSARLSMVIDSKRAWLESKSPSVDRLSRELIVSPSLEQVKDYLDKALEASRVSVDVETMGKWIDCVGFSTHPASAICIPRGEVQWGSKSEMIDSLLREFLWNHTGLVAQNASFDMTMLLGNGLPIRRLHMDTQVAHHFMYPELPHDLHYLVSIYTKEPFYKWMLRDAFKKGDLRERWTYNCLDAAVTSEVARELVSELCEFKVEKEFFGYVMPLFHTILKMGLRGVRADQEYQNRLQRVLTYLIGRRQTDALNHLGLKGKYLQDYQILAIPATLPIGKPTEHRRRVKAVPEFNLGSPAQLKKLLYELWCFPKQYQRKSKSVTVDDEAIKKLMKVRRPVQCPVELKTLQRILDVRDAKKRKSTYADLELSFDGRLRTLYSVTGTETGRLSSKQDYFGQGWNSQNPPKWFRKIVVPEKGSVLIEADLKFAEALLTAWFAKDIATIEAVRKGADIYRWHGAKMFEKAPEQITKAERNLVKPVVLGCGYGLGPNHLAEMLGVSVARGKELRSMFFRSCPAILDYQAWVREQLETTRTLVTPFNRRRTFLGRMGEELFRKGYAFLPQSTCAEYLNRALVRVDLQVLPDTHLLLQVHDAMVLSTSRESMGAVVDLVCTELAVPVVIRGEHLVIPVEVKKSEKSWGEMEEVGVYNGFKS
jgi:uracil-DNA glycosylase family 4